MLTVPPFCFLSSFGINCSHLQVAVDPDREVMQVEIVRADRVFKVFLKERTGTWAGFRVTNCSSLPGCRTFCIRTRNGPGQTGRSWSLELAGAQHEKHRFFAPELQIPPYSKLLSFFMFHLNPLTSLSQMCTGHLKKAHAPATSAAALSYLSRPGTCWLLYWSCL